ncbi:Endosulphine [Neofusicoccum parvum]|uniref:mRNA stability protein n=1 Tax=Botryosphaeria parva (strain UCR-NP2) TaxID=1287680 RepID=R1EJG3_BOTPV|nr:putative camp-regulated phosphoprotein family protein [Neofusicoccum parvum UCRNP2]GME34839.1 Endosulphine [Neofusicoccum parvum]
MNPHQKNKVDISSLSAEEQRLFRLYGKLPNRKDLLQNKLKERKYFDSGDYALSKAGKADDVGVTQIGREHPVPENIPHSSSPHTGNGGITLPAPHHPNGQGSSPVKENSFIHRETSLNRETSVDDEEMEGAKDGLEAKAEEEGKAVPIRQS